MPAHPRPPARAPSFVLAVIVASVAIAAVASAVTGAVTVAPTPNATHAARTSRSGTAGLPYSTASGSVVQHQPRAGSCRARPPGLYARPDPRCTPGALNPAVTRATVSSTICRSGWTATVRPAESITEPEKFASMEAYGDEGDASVYEYDHLVPLELGGAVNDARNLWPEPDYGSYSGYYRNPKDHLERTLNRLVCSGRMPLVQAQRLIATDWVSAYRRYG
jgi:hypothetical protein